jgi:hypothetical protein
MRDHPPTPDPVQAPGQTPHLPPWELALYAATVAISIVASALWPGVWGA